MFSLKPLTWPASTNQSERAFVLWHQHVLLLSLHALFSHVQFFLKTLVMSWHHIHSPSPNSGSGLAVSWAAIQCVGSPARLSKLPASLVLLKCQPSLTVGPISPTLFFFSSGPNAMSSHGTDWRTADLPARYTARSSGSLLGTHQSSASWLTL